MATATDKGREEAWRVIRAAHTPGQETELVCAELSRIRSEAKAESLMAAVNRVHGIKLKWRKNDTARIKDYKQAANEGLDHAIAAILDEEFDNGCTWAFDGDTAWRSACGRSWVFEDGGPDDNGVNFCHGCGKPVRLADEPNKEE